MVATSLTASPVINNRRRERIFYSGMAVLIVITVFSGFARTFYLRPYFQTQPLIPLLIIHGTIFTSWLALLLTQTTLVATKRIQVHRRLGIAGGVLAVLMLLIGTITAIIRAKVIDIPPGSPPPLTFLTIPLGDMLVFGILVGAAFYFRRKARHPQAFDVTCHHWHLAGSCCPATLRLHRERWTAGVFRPQRFVHHPLPVVRHHYARASPSRHCPGRLADRWLTTATTRYRRHSSLADIRYLVDELGGLTSRGRQCRRKIALSS